MDAPPNRERMEEVPLALLLGPALTMGVTSLVMGAVAVSNYLAGTSTLSSVIPTLVMSLSMLCGTVLWPMLTKRHEKKKKNAAEQLRQANTGNIWIPSGTGWDGSAPGRRKYWRKTAPTCRNAPSGFSNGSADCGSGRRSMRTSSGCGWDWENCLWQ